MTESEQQKVIDQVYDYAADLLINEKSTPHEIKQSLIAQGIDESTAHLVVEKIEAEVVDERRKAANKDMLYGALWCIGGTIVTAVSYSAASGGGTYVVTWGAIFFGGIQFFKGLINSNT